MLEKKSLFKQTYKNIMCIYMHGSRGRDRGSAPHPTPPEKSQKYRACKKNGPDPLKNHKAAEPVFNVGPVRCETPFI